MSADGKCPLSIVDMLLNDTSTLDVFDKPTMDVFDKPATDDEAEVSRYYRTDIIVCFTILSRFTRRPTVLQPRVPKVYDRWAVSEVESCTLESTGVFLDLFLFLYNPREP